MLFPPCARLEPTANPIAHVVASISTSPASHINLPPALGFYEALKGVTCRDPIGEYELLSKLLVSPLIMENQMEKKMENEMETGII